MTTSGHGCKPKATQIARLRPTDRADPTTNEARQATIATVQLQASRTKKRATRSKQRLAIIMNFQLLAEDVPNFNADGDHDTRVLEVDFRDLVVQEVENICQAPPVLGTITAKALTNAIANCDRPEALPVVLRRVLVVSHDKTMRMLSHDKNVRVNRTVRSTRAAGTGL
jgi:hypothetical protein